MKKLDVVLGWSMTCVVLQVAGCGKTEDADARNDDMSDEASRPLAGLGDAEVEEVCEEFWRMYDDVMPAYERGICIVESVESTSGGESCETAVDVCVDDIEVLVVSIDDCAETLDFTGCDASVAELNECIAAQRQQVQRIAALRSCEDALGQGASTGEWLDDAPACERLIDRCPAAFEEPGDVDGSGAEGSPGATPHVIEGTVDGDAVEIRPDDGLGQSHSVSGTSWNSSLEFGGATLWLWGEVETAQGLLRMPPGGSEAPSWLCLDAVEIERGSETSTWESGKLSLLPLCPADDRQPLELSFAIGYAVSGTLGGEAVDWVSAGFSCASGSTCRFEFQAADTAWTGRDRWFLELDTSLESGVSKAFEHATLIHPSGAGAMACGGGGVVSWDEDNEFRIVVDALGPLTECPGTSVDGELRGAF